MRLTKSQSKHPLIANRTAFMIIGCLEAAWATLVPYVKSAFSLDEGTLGLLMLHTSFAAVAVFALAAAAVSAIALSKIPNTHEN